MLTRKAARCAELSVLAFTGQKEELSRAPVDTVVRTNLPSLSLFPSDVLFLTAKGTLKDAEDSLLPHRKLWFLGLFPLRFFLLFSKTQLQAREKTRQAKHRLCIQETQA